MVNAPNESPSDDQLLRIQDVVRLTTLSRSSVNLWVATNRFPKPIPLSTTIKVWPAKVVRAWIQEKAQSSEAPL